MSLGATGPAQAVCSGPGAPTTTQTKCLTAVAIPGNPLRSFDISFVNPLRGEYYLADRSNAGIDVITTAGPTFKQTIGGFVGIVLTTSGAVNNNKSGPDGVAAHGKWLYAGDGNSTLKVIDLDAGAIAQTISTGGLFRLDEMALTGNGLLLFGANNADDPPFGTLFRANADNPTTNVAPIAQVQVDPNIIPPGAGLSIEQPAWEPLNARFFTSIPQIANNPPGCVFSAPGTLCQGGLLVFDPTNITASQCETLTPGPIGVPICTLGPYNATTNTGVIPLNACGPNGATVGQHSVLLLGCTPGNVATNLTTLVVSTTRHDFPWTNIGNITGSDEVWYNSGDQRYYLGASKNCTTFVPNALDLSPPHTCALASQQTAVLGVVDNTSVLIETIPQSSGSHSVAADSTLNRIFVPQVAPSAVVGSGGDTTTVGAGICGTNNGCVAVYQH
jgi:hypothetical protein